MPRGPHKKDLLFCDLYEEKRRDGFMVEEAAEFAAIESGVTLPKGTAKSKGALRGAQALMKPSVSRELAKRRGGKEIYKVIEGMPSTREEREVFFAEIMRDENVKTADRIKSAELAGKMSGDFIERKQVQALVGVKDVSKLSDKELMELVGVTDDE